MLHWALVTTGTETLWSTFGDPPPDERAPHPLTVADCPARASPATDESAKHAGTALGPRVTGVFRWTIAKSLFKLEEE